MIEQIVSLRLEIPYIYYEALLQMINKQIRGNYFQLS